ncbi:MAG: hypothetical protein ABW019_05870 [Chitinophagaceae bacterium]
MYNAENNLFTVRLNDTGVLYIRKLFRLSGLIFVAMIATSLFSIYFDISSYISMRRMYDTPPSLLYPIRVYAYVAILIGNSCAGYYYFRFSRRLFHSTDNSNEESFNQSFRYIYYNAAIFATILVITLLLDILILLNMVRVFL